MERRVLEISWVGLWRILFFVATAAILFLSLDILLGLFLAVVISSGLEFMVNFLERRGIPRTLGVIMIFLVAVIGIIVTVYAILPLLIVETNIALSSLSKISRGAWWADLINFKAAKSLSEFLNSFSAQWFGSAGSPFQVFSDLFGGVTLGFFVVISSFYLSLGRDGVERFIRAVFPRDSEVWALQVYEQSITRIGYWFRTQIMLSFIVGALVMLSLYILGVKYAFLLGVVAAFLELVPFVGPIIAGSFAVLSALTTSPGLAFATLIIFLAIHQVESHFLVPLLLGKRLGLHPVVVLISLLIGAKIFGVLGALVAVPAAVIFQELIEQWSKKEPE